MEFLKRYFKCLWQRRLMGIVLIFIGLGLACVGVYSFYNPSHEYYSVIFNYDDMSSIDPTLLKNKEFNNNVKDEIQLERAKKEYIILNDYKYMEYKDTYTYEKDENGAYIIYDNGTKIDFYGVVDGIYDGYIYLDNYWQETYGYSVTYNNGVVELKNDSETLTFEASWDKQYNYSYSSFDYVKVKKLSKSVKYKINDDGSVTFYCQVRYFNSWQQARRFMMRMANDLNTSVKAKFLNGEGNLVTSDSAKTIDLSIVSSSGSVKMLPYAIIGASVGFLIDLLIVLVLVIVKKEKAIDRLQYDNDRIYKYPFHLSYWKKSLNELKTLKKVVMLAMLFAMMQVVRLIPLPSGFGNLGISLSAFFFAIIGLLYGPSISLVVGMISDVFGFFVFPDGYPFHFGYTLQAGLTGFTYGICFYKTKVSFSKCLFARIVVNLFLNAFLGSLFWADVADLNSAATRTYMMTLAYPKNIAYLIPQSVIMYLVFKALAPAFKALNLVEPEICDDLSSFDVLELKKEENNDCNNEESII